MIMMEERVGFLLNSAKFCCAASLFEVRLEIIGVIVDVACMEVEDESDKTTVESDDLLKLSRILEVCTVALSLGGVLMIRTFLRKSRFLHENGLLKFLGGVNKF